MYNCPLTDSFNAPSLSDLLITATEQLETMRRDSELERLTVSQEMVTPPPTITAHSKECDKVLLSLIAYTVLVLFL